MKSPCIGCRRENEDKNFCIGSCQELAKFQNSLGYPIAKSVTSETYSIGRLGSNGGRRNFLAPAL